MSTFKTRKEREAEKQENEEAFGACLGLIVGLLVIIPLVVLIAWNLGVVGVVAAAGGSVAGINYWSALGVSAIYILLRGILKVVG